MHASFIRYFDLLERQPAAQDEIIRGVTLDYTDVQLAMEAEKVDEVTVISPLFT